MTLSTLTARCGFGVFRNITSDDARFAWKNKDAANVFCLRDFLRRNAKRESARVIRVPTLRTAAKRHFAANPDRSIIWILYADDSVRRLVALEGDKVALSRKVLPR